MLNDWLYWLTSLHPEEVLTVFAGLVLLDTPRYALTTAAMCLWDAGCQALAWARGTPQLTDYSHCPSVCAIIPGHNEADTIGATLGSLWGSYPRLEIIVVDDGSTDGMSRVAEQFARRHPGVLVIRRGQRGGKSSAINFGLRHTRAKVILTVDADSHLGPRAVWEVVQPLKDPRVGVVSAIVLSRNARTNLVTALQAFEYLSAILVGRILSARLGVLGIASGAFAAFRRSVVERGMGWDVGPGEDADITIRARKPGFKVAVAPRAVCYTNVPTRLTNLFRQRFRWNRSVIRHKCRKHIDMAFVWSPNFRLSNLVHLLDVWFFTVLRTYAFWAYCLWLLVHWPAHTEHLLLSTYLGYVLFGILQATVILYYGDDLRRDALVATVVPLVPLYRLFLRVARTLAYTQELLYRRSYQDSFAPVRVRDATWHW